MSRRDAFLKNDKQPKLTEDARIRDFIAVRVSSNTVPRSSSQPFYTLRTRPSSCSHPHPDWSSTSRSSTSQSRTASIPSYLE